MSFHMYRRLELVRGLVEKERKHRQKVEELEYEINRILDSVTNELIEYGDCDGIEKMIHHFPPSIQRAELREFYKRETGGEELREFYKRETGGEEQ